MPGGGGGGPPAPPLMRWALWRREPKLAVYRDARPWARFAGGLVIVCVCCLILHTQAVALWGKAQPRAVAPAVAIMLAVALVCQFVVRRLWTRSELNLDASHKTITFRQVPPWGWTRTQTLQASDVAHAVVVRKFRGGPYTSLHLNLADNRTRLVDEGKEQEQMDRLIEDLCAVVGVAPRRILGTSLAGPRFVAVARSPEQVRYLELRNRERRYCVVGYLLMGAAFLAVAFAPPIAALRLTHRPTVENLLSALPGSTLMMLWFAAAGTFGLVGLHAGITALRYLQLVELVVHKKGVGLTLRSVSLRGRPTAEDWTSSEITDVVTVGRARKRGFENRQVWLRRRDGRRVLLDRVEPLAISRPGTPGQEQTLNHFAIELSQELGVPIKHVVLGWFRRWFST